MNGIRSNQILKPMWEKRIFKEEKKQKEKQNRITTILKQIYKENRALEIEIVCDNRENCERRQTQKKMKKLKQQQNLCCKVTATAFFFGTLYSWENSFIIFMCVCVWYRTTMYHDQTPHSHTKLNKLLLISLFSSIFAVAVAISLDIKRKAKETLRIYTRSIYFPVKICMFHGNGLFTRNFIAYSAIRRR